MKNVKIIPYTAVITAKKQLEIFDRFPFWRIMLSTASPNGGNFKKLLEKRKFAIDNGAYADFKNNRPFQETKFMALVKNFGSSADFIVIPDSIGNRMETINLANQWIPILEGLPLSLCVQDGMMEDDIIPFLPKIKCIFVGGSTEWKLKYLKYWANIAKIYKITCHVGRVNTIKRAKKCYEASCNSFDGSGFAMYRNELKNMSYYISMISNQLSLFSN